MSHLRSNNHDIKKEHEELNDQPSCSDYYAVYIIVRIVESFLGMTTLLLVFIIVGLL